MPDASATVRCDVVVTALAAVVPPPYDFQRNITEVVARIVKGVVADVMPIVENLVGLWVEFYFPEAQKKGPYGYLSDIPYPKTPNLTKRCVVQSLFVERLESGGQLDAYNMPPPVVWLLGDDEIPYDTRVKLLVRDNLFLWFQVDNVKTLYGVDDAFLKKLTLIPVAAKT